MTEWVSTPSQADRRPDWKVRLKRSLQEESWSPSLNTIVQKILDDIELDVDDGTVLFQEPNLFEVGKLALLHKQAMFEDRAYFNSNVHINQTNICVLACRFCAFRRGPKADDAYAVSYTHLTLPTN